MYPERRRMPHSNQIDWRVAAFDGLGLLLFFVPGVIAFVVDFYTGAIYLPAGPVPYPGAYPPPPSGIPTYPPNVPPPGSAAPWPAPPAVSLPVSPTATVPAAQQPANSPPVNSSRFTQQQIPPTELNLPRIERIVADHVGRQVSLQESDARVSRLPRIDLYADQCQQHRTSPKFGTAVKNFFEGLRQA